MEQLYLKSPIYYELGMDSFQLNKNTVTYKKRFTPRYPTFNYQGKDILQLQENAFSQTYFSDSQRLVILKDVEYVSRLKGACCIIQSITSANDLLDCVQKVKLVRQTNPSLEIMLYIPYLLGGRSDRQFDTGQIHYLRDVIAPVINQLNLSVIFLTDPHSDVTEAVFTCKTVNLSAIPGMIHSILYDIFDCHANTIESVKATFGKSDLIDNIIGRFKGFPQENKENKYGFPFLIEPRYNDSDRKVLFVAPDAGAVKRLDIALKHLREIYTEQSLIDNVYDLTDESIFKTTFAIKHRDLRTGNIDSITLAMKAEEVNQFTDIIVVDDLFDGGRTFEELMLTIKKDYQFQGKSYLIAPHAIFSRTDMLTRHDKLFDKIYVTDSFLSVNSLLSKGVDSFYIETDYPCQANYSEKFSLIDDNKLYDKEYNELISELVEVKSNLRQSSLPRLSIFSIKSEIKL